MPLYLIATAGTAHDSSVYTLKRVRTVSAAWADGLWEEASFYVTRLAADTRSRPSSRRLFVDGSDPHSPSPLPANVMFI